MLVYALLSAALAIPAADPVKPFEFKDGDRVVWLGNTLVEREQRYGYWETALLAANADKNITVRNLGWSGDTVYGDARAGFDNATKGYERMVSLALELKPTVIFINFGTNEAFEGKEGLPKFEKGLEKLLDSLKPANARIVLFTPLPFCETYQTPNVKERNQAIQIYAEAIRVLAKNRNLYLADANKIIGDVTLTAGFTPPFGPGLVGPDVTLNGMHLTEKGYKYSAPDFLVSLGQKKFEGSAEAFDSLRQAVIAKNEQFFNKWRPQNETYLFGFRKHEQGKNAKEIAEFDPFIAKAEDEIAKLQKGLK